MVRINEMVNILAYHPLIQPLVFLYSPWDVISLQNACWILSNFYISPYVGKIFKFMEFTFLENALIPDIFTHVLPHSKPSYKFFSSWSRQKEIVHSPRHHSFKKMFPLAAERGGGHYDLLCENSVGKYEDDLQH